MLGGLNSTTLNAVLGGLNGTTLNAVLGGASSTTLNAVLGGLTGTTLNTVLGGVSGTTLNTVLGGASSATLNAVLGGVSGTTLNAVLGGVSDTTLNAVLGGLNTNTLSAVLGGLTTTTLNAVLGGLDTTTLNAVLGGVSGTTLNTVLGGASSTTLNAVLGGVSGTTLNTVLGGVSDTTLNAVLGGVSGTTLNTVLGGLNTTTLSAVLGGASSTTLNAVLGGLTGTTLNTVLGGLNSSALNAVLGGLTSTTLNTVLGGVSGTTLNAVLGGVSGTTLNTVLGGLGSTTLNTVLGGVSGTTLNTVLGGLGSGTLNAVLGGLTSTTLNTVLGGLTSTTLNAVLGGANSTTINAVLGGLSGTTLNTVLGGVNSTTLNAVLGGASGTTLNAVLGGLTGTTLNAVLGGVNSTTLNTVLGGASGTTLNAVLGGLTGTTLNTVLGGITTTTLNAVLGGLGTGTLNTVLGGLSSGTLNTVLGGLSSGTLNTVLGGLSSGTLNAVLGGASGTTLNAVLGGLTGTTLNAVLGGLTTGTLNTVLGGLSTGTLNTVLGGASNTTLNAVLGGVGSGTLNTVLGGVGSGTLNAVLGGLSGTTLNTVLGGLSGTTLNTVLGGLNTTTLNTVLGGLSGTTLNTVLGGLSGTTLNTVLGGLSGTTLNTVLGGVGNGTLNAVLGGVGSGTLNTVLGGLSGTTLNTVLGGLSGTTLNTVLGGLSGTTLNTVLGGLSGTTLNTVLGGLSGTTLNTVLGSVGSGTLNAVLGGVGSGTLNTVLGGLNTGTLNTVLGGLDSGTLNAVLGGLNTTTLNVVLGGLTGTTLDAVLGGLTTGTLNAVLGGVGSGTLNTVLGGVGSGTLNTVLGGVGSGTLNTVLGGVGSGTLNTVLGGLTTGTLNAVLGGLDTNTLNAVLGGLDTNTLNAVLGGLTSSTLDAVLGGAGSGTLNTVLGGLTSNTLNAVLGGLTSTTLNAILGGLTSNTLNAVLGGVTSTTLNAVLGGLSGTTLNAVLGGVSTNALNTVLGEVSTTTLNALVAAVDPTILNTLVGEVNAATLANLKVNPGTLNEVVVLLPLVTLLDAATLPTVAAGAAITPLSAVAASAAITPLPVAAAGAEVIPLPVVAAGAAITPMPAVAAGATITPLPVVAAGAAITPVPAVVAGAAITSLPVVAAGAATTVLPAVAAGATITPLPVVAAGATITPLPVVAAGAAITPLPVAAAGATITPLPVVAAGATITPLPAAAAGTEVTPLPVAATGAEVTPVPAAATDAGISPMVILELVVSTPALVDALLVNQPTFLQSLFEINPTLYSQAVTNAGLQNIELNINLTGSGNQVVAGLFSTVNMGSGGVLTENITPSQLAVVNQAVSNGLAASSYQLTATATGSNNVMVGGLLSNLSATGGGNNRFVIEDPGLLGLTPGTAVSAAIYQNGGTFNGSGGTDTFSFVGGDSGFNFGNVTLNEPTGAATNSTLDFSNFQGGGVNLNLTTAGTQTVTKNSDGSTNLSLTLPAVPAITNAIGSPGNDTIIGSGINGTVKGSQVDNPDPYARAAVPPTTAQTQWVYLDFTDFPTPLATDIGEVVSFQNPGIPDTMTANNASLTGPAAFVYVDTTTAGTATTPAVQTITFSGNVTGGSFTLSLNGSQTAPILWNSNPTTLAANIQTALNDINANVAVNPTVIPITESLHNGTGSYTASDEQAILQGLQNDFAAFNNQSLNGGTFNLTQFTLDPTVIPAGTPYETVYFNVVPISNAQPSPGGKSNEIDFRNLNLNTSMVVDVNGFLGTGLYQQPDTDANFIGMSITVTAHELGHTLGLRHEDSYDPIGFGISNPPGAGAYYPAYTGPVAAFNTLDNIIASPASVGSTLQELATGQASFGERDAISLAFISDGTVVDGTNHSGDDGPYTVSASAAQANPIYLVSETPPTPSNPTPGTTTTPGTMPTNVSAQPVSLYQLNVPNPVTTGYDAGMNFDVAAVDVLGTLAAGSATTTSPDFYTFQATAGSLMSFYVKSAALTRITDPIDSVLYLYGPNGQLLTWNDDQFEPSDSSIIDETLPTTGTYTVEVDDYQHATGQASTGGDYELFMYRFAAYNTTTGTDVLVSSSNPNVALTPSTTNAVYGQGITFSVAVTPNGFANVTPGGTVTFKDGTTVLDVTTLSNGSTSYQTSALTLGAHNITAVYSGDSYFSATTVTATVNVLQPATTTTVTASASGANYTFTATVAAALPPTGNVVFVDTTTSTTLGTISLTNGTATLTTSALTLGTHTISAAYSGNSVLLPSSGTVSVTVTAVTSTTAYVLDPTAANALTLSGNAQLVVGGIIAVDSNATNALSASGNAIVTGSAVRVHGAVKTSGNAHISPAPTTGAASFTDPLASLVAPTASGTATAVNVSGNSSLMIYPGLYSGISVSGNGNLTMNPGIYVIQGGGFSVSGNGNVSGNGVMIDNAGNGSSYGNINLSGNGNISLTPMTSGPYDGILFFQPRTNTKTITLSGNGIVMPGGLIYAPTAPLGISGNGQFRGSLIVDTINISGNTILNQSTGAGGTVYTPAQIRSAYGINSAALDGTGQTIAIVDAYDDPNIYQSLDTFDLQFSLTTTSPSLFEQYGPASSFLTVLNQQGQTTPLPATDPTGAGVSNWEMEIALDVEWVHALAPGANIVLVESNSQSLADLMTGVATAADQPGVSVVSMSWGFAENQMITAQQEALYDSYLTTPAGHQGVTFVASTGDYGAADPEYPAYSPNVVAVGGTSLTLNADDSYNSETAWGYYSSTMGQFIGSGGGLSQFEAEPAWQLGVQSTGSRSTPDVAAVADPATGAWIADTYNLLGGSPMVTVGGTSLSAPNWAGLLVLANQGRALAGKASFGTASPNEAQQDLYSVPVSDFHQITSGSNGTFNAGAGYNLATGLGSPVANLLLPDLINATPNGGVNAQRSVTVTAQSVADMEANATAPYGSINGMVAAIVNVFNAEFVAAPDSDLDANQNPIVQESGTAAFPATEPRTDTGKASDLQAPTQPETYLSLPGSFTVNGSAATADTMNSGIPALVLGNSGAQKGYSQDTANVDSNPWDSGPNLAALDAIFEGLGGTDWFDSASGSGYGEFLERGL